VVREGFAGRNFADDMAEWMTCQQSWLGHTHLAGLLQSFPISEQQWESMLIDCITGMVRAQWTDNMYVMINQFTHFSMISLEMTELSIREMLRVHEQLRVIASNL
jgi:hypothetical protein